MWELTTLPRLPSRLGKGKFLPHFPVPQRLLCFGSAPLALLTSTPSAPRTPLPTPTLASQPCLVDLSVAIAVTTEKILTGYSHVNVSAVTQLHDTMASFAFYHSWLAATAEKRLILAQQTLLSVYFSLILSRRRSPLFLIWITKLITECVSPCPCDCWHVQQVKEYTPMTWGLYSAPPPNIPKCGFLGEFCLPPIQGEWVTCILNNDCDNS